MLTAALAYGYASMLNGRVLVVGTHDATTSNSFYSFLHYESQQQSSSTGSIDFLNSADVRRFSSEFELSSYIQSVRDHYDIVLVDTAPLMSLTGQEFDPVVLSTFLDVSVLLLSGKSLERDAMKFLQQVLRRNDLNILGSIFNQRKAR